MNNTKPLFSDTISFLRFPLAFLVVMIHNNPLGILTLLCANDPSIYQSYPVYFHIYHALTDNIARIAVPLFFFFSGFLFFLKYETKIEDKKSSSLFSYYIVKLRKALHGIVIPYIIWNLIFIAFTCTIQICFKNYLRGNQMLYEDYKLMDWLRLIWNPTDSPLWFIRDLFIVNLCSLPMYYILKNRYTGLLFIGGLLYKWLFMNTWIFGIMACDSFLFFSIGAYMTIHRIDFTKYRKSLAKPTLLLYTVLIFVEAYIWANGYTITHCIEYFMILIGMCMAVNCVALYVDNPAHKWNSSLAKTSFFIYVFHNMPLVIMLRVYGFVVPQNEWTLLFGYFVFPFVTVAVVLGVYKLLEKYTPKLLFVLNGSR